MRPSRSTHAAAGLFLLMAISLFAAGCASDGTSGDVNASFYASGYYGGYYGAPYPYYGGSVIVAPPRPPAGVPPGGRPPAPPPQVQPLPSRPMPAPAPRPMPAVRGGGGRR